MQKRRWVKDKQNFHMFCAPPIKGIAPNCGIPKPAPIIGYDPPRLDPKDIDGTLGCKLSIVLL